MAEQTQKRIEKHVTYMIISQYHLNHWFPNLSWIIYWFVMSDFKGRSICFALPQPVQLPIHHTYVSTDMKAVVVVTRIS